MIYMNQIMMIENIMMI
ncbi:hypothetical protein cmbei_9000040 [Cryptosporidium meleagridis]